MKTSARIFFIAFCLITAMSASSCRTEAGHNKYREAKIKPSQQQMREDKRVEERNSKNYKKQMRSNRKHVFGRAVAPH